MDGSDAIGDEYCQEASTSKKSNRYYKQFYRKAWENLPEFKGWLKQAAGTTDRGYCIACNKSLHAHRLSLLKHTCTVKHMKAMQKQFKVNSHEYETITEDLILNVDDIQVLHGDYVVDDESDVKVEIRQIDHLDQITDNSIHSSTLNCENSDFTASTMHDYRKETIMSNDLVTTHVLDTSKGLAVPSLRVSLYRLIDGRWTMISECHTNSSGHCGGFVDKNNFVIGRYKIHFDVDQYFKADGKDALYPFVEIIFDVKNVDSHYHIPLVLSPFGYTTYFGTQQC